jgi:hypothetical protein
MSWSATGASSHEAGISSDLGEVLMKGVASVLIELEQEVLGCK